MSPFALPCQTGSRHRISPALASGQPVKVAPAKTDSMAANKLPKKISKKKPSRDKAAEARRQGAVPCLIIAALVLLIFAFIFFASLKTL
jgi:hypothetical protein